MSRAIVLVLCLASAAGVAAYTHSISREPSEQVAVFTVPQRVEVPAARPGNSEFSSDKASLARQLQRELVRVGCYSGEINGVWTTSSRMAMKAFVDRVNSKLPIDAPDPILLSLLQGQRGEVCGTSCTVSQATADGAACIAKAATDKASEPAIREGTASPAGTSVPLAAGAAVAAAAPIPPKDAEQKSSLTGERTRPLTPAPDSGPAADSSREPRRKEAAGPPGGERRQRRSWKDPAKPPRVVRDFLRGIERTFGLK